MDDPVYRGAYLEELAAVVAGPFEPARMETRYRELHALIEPYVTGPLGERPGFTLLEDPADFDPALEELVAHAWRRSAAIGEFLGQIENTPDPTEGMQAGEPPIERTW